MLFSYSPQNYTALKMFYTSSRFFRDLGLLGMPKEFWKYSVINKPINKQMECHASAEDFMNQIDFRYKFCIKFSHKYNFYFHSKLYNIIGKE